MIIIDHGFSTWVGGGQRNCMWGVNILIKNHDYTAEIAYTDDR